MGLTLLLCVKLGILKQEHMAAVGWVNEYKECPKDRTFIPAQVSRV